MFHGKPPWGQAAGCQRQTPKSQGAFATGRLNRVVLLPGETFTQAMPGINALEVNLK